MAHHKALAGVLLALSWVWACAGRHYPLDLLRGNANDLSQYVNRLEPAERDRRTLSSLWIQPDALEQFIEVSYSADHYQVMVSFCPEARYEQERHLLEFTGSIPEDVFEGTAVGENRCGYLRAFSFKSSTETTRFLHEVLDVLAATGFEYELRETTLK